ncbi:MAG: DNA helicase UvrD [Candidatus Pacebacteria bacterium]|nr:DNA helicase UvrD [Candidatus Paceibacterota bacterium]
MKYVADFHIHSKYARAVSPRMDLENLDKAAKIKGIKVLGTGDFTHPKWLEQIKQKLEPAEPGLFKLKNNNSQTRFLLTAEISCIYPKNGKTRKVHIIVFSPDIKTVEKINTQLNLIGNLKSDGRPILGLDAKELVKIVLNINPDCFNVPAHIWTPWFSLLGSKSGFDSIEECFEEYSKHIYALETGLSSDPAMNWRLSALDRFTLISNSDSHSPERIGREANIFELKDISYLNIINAIKSKDKKRFLYTIEFFPEEGRYHYDGHRKCNVCLSPEESKKSGNICPVCGKILTIGVLNRVQELADRDQGFIPKNAIPFKSLIPLTEIIGESIGLGVKTKGVDKEYQKLIKSFNNELNILLEVSQKDLESISSSKIAEGIIKVRKGEVFIKPGYDGEYGKVQIFSKLKKNKQVSQKTML